MPWFRDNWLLTAIAAAAVSVAALTAFDAFGDGAGRSREFQSLVRGLGLGCQGNLAHGIALFDPRLQGGEPEILGPMEHGRERCAWHPLTIFPAPAAVQYADGSDK